MQLELTEHGQSVFGQEDWALGQRFSNQDFLNVPMWPYIDKVIWLRPPKDMQVGAGATKAMLVQLHLGSSCALLTMNKTIIW